MHEITAEIAESHYGDCKAAFCEKAASVGLQIHWNMSVILMGGHSCFDSFHFEMYTPGKMDHIVVDNKMRCYQFNGSHRDGWMVRRYLCRKIKQQGLLSMKWEDVGVFQVVGMEEDYIIIPKKSVCGRGVMDEANRIYVWTRDMQDC